MLQNYPMYVQEDQISRQLGMSSRGTSRMFKSYRGNADHITCFSNDYLATKAISHYSL